MKRILVVDVAAEKGGALTVLNKYIENTSSLKNQYFFVLSKELRDDTDTQTYIYLPWIKRSYFHRLVFDFFYVRYLVWKYDIDEVVSLQNNAFILRDIPQTVLLHNALFFSKQKYSIFQSKTIWIYQNIISKYIRYSLNFANRIIVQANWIKRVLIDEWSIPSNSIVVEPPIINSNETSSRVELPNKTCFFYPANGSIYKNHINVFKAFAEINSDKYALLLTGNLLNLNKECKNFLKDNSLPIVFLDTLSSEELNYIYSNSILIFPSLIETVGLPLIEAQNHKSMIICSNLEYAKEATKDYENTMYFDPYSINSIRDSIIKCIENRGLL